MIANQLSRGVDEWMVVINAVLAACSVGMNLVYAMRAPDRPARVLHACIAGLAVCYVVAYLYLIASSVEVQDWSAVMRGVSTLAWVIVWIDPAVQRNHRVMTKQMIRAVQVEMRKDGVAT